MRYEILLFDTDNTILDFDKAEEQALKLAFEKNKLYYDDNVLMCYRRNNIRQWQLYESGAIKDKNEVLISRFENTFRELNLFVDCKPTADLYEDYLHDGCFVISNAEEVLQKLQALNCKLYIVTNGVLSIQNSRMKGSGMDKYFVKRFVSEEIGFPKPSKAYFDYCFDNIPNFEKTKTLIIGDSLTSDIQGGINSGIDTCWYNPKRLKNNSRIAPTYEIDDLEQVLKIVLEKRAV